MLHPSLIRLAALTQQFLGELGMAANVSEEIDDLAFAHQAQQMAIDNDAIKALINPLQVGLKEFKKQLHRRPPSGRVARVAIFTAADATPDAWFVPEALKQGV
jgi:hypothetical protein